MRYALIALAASALTLGACSQAERADAKAAADKVATETKEAAADVKDMASSPEVKAAGADIKDAAKDAGAAVKDAAGDAARETKSAIHDATAPSDADEAKN
jgi:hypothetical protein